MFPPFPASEKKNPFLISDRSFPSRSIVYSFHSFVSSTLSSPLAVLANFASPLAPPNPNVTFSPPLSPRAQNANFFAPVTLYPPGCSPFQSLAGSCQKIPPQLSTALYSTFMHTFPVCGFVSHLSS